MSLSAANDLSGEGVAGPLPPPRTRQHLWILRRLAFGVVVLLAVSVVIFVATRALPTDPAQAILGRSATPDALASLRKHLGLDQPLYRQYLTWLGNVVRGDLGTSTGNE